MRSSVRSSQAQEAWRDSPPFTFELRTIAASKLWRRRPSEINFATSLARPLEVASPGRSDES